MLRDLHDEHVGSATDRHRRSRRQFDHDESVLGSVERSDGRLEGWKGRIEIDVPIRVQRDRHRFSGLNFFRKLTDLPATMKIPPPR